MSGSQFEVNPEMAGNLRLIGIGPERNREMGLEVFDRDRLVIFEFQALCSECWDRNDAGAEYGAALGFFGTAFPHLEQSRINRLLFQLVVNLSSAFAFEDDGGNAHGSVPNGKIGNGSPAG